MPLSRAFQKLVEGGLLTALASRPPPQPMPPHFRLDLHCAYHQGPGHDTSHCSALRHAIQGLVNLGQPCVTMNPLLAHTTHSMSPPTSGIHHMDFVQDDVIHMLNWDDGLSEMIILNNGYEIIFDINDEIAQLDLDRDSFDHDSDPIDERVSPATGDIETVDFGTDDQPRKLKIGLPLSIDEKDRLIHLLKSYLDVFAWSYEDMPSLDPSIVQHHLPILPHARPVKQKLR
uniref:Uncharacterized protein n=1 Tax=Vitis vinifera TaxID=29760 RepID=F6I704_VITVI